MADRNTDHPSQKGIGAALKRRFTGASAGPSFGREYYEILSERNNDYNILYDLDPLAGILRGLIATMVTIVPAFGIAFGIDVASRVELDRAEVQNSATAAYGYQTIGLNNGRHWTLVRQDGEFGVYLENGRRIEMVASTAQALEIIRAVDTNLKQAITALESGQIPEDDIPQILQYASISEAFIDQGGNIDRVVAGVAEDGTAQGRNLLVRLKSAQAFWQEAGQSLMTGNYGYDAAERAPLKVEQDAHGKTVLGGVGTLALGILLGVTAPFTLGAATTVSRRRRRSKMDRKA